MQAGAKLLPLLTLGLFAVSACARSADHREPQAAPGGQGVEVPIGAGRAATLGMALPSDLPVYAQVYPGADVKAVVVTAGGPMGSMISYVTSAKPELVLAFHKKN